VLCVVDKRVITHAHTCARAGKEWDRLLSLATALTDIASASDVVLLSLRAVLRVMRLHAIAHVKLSVDASAISSTTALRTLVTSLFK
jgi:hypothetical protein